MAITFSAWKTPRCRIINPTNFPTTLVYIFSTSMLMM